MSNTPVGMTLANAVADQLAAGRSLAHKHPEYCGMGLHCADGVFIYSEVFDGDLLNPTQHQNLTAGGSTVEFQAFPDRAAFVQWLAAQTDDSLSGQGLEQWRVNNQRLSLQRLTEFTKP